MNRRAFLKTTAATTTLLASSRGWSAEAARQGPGDDEILVQTKDRIAKHRQGNGVVIVRNAAGQLISGATVKVEQLRHDFLFGCNFFMFGRFKEAEREEEYRRRFAALLNYATLGFYWGAYEPERGRPRYEYTDIKNPMNVWAQKLSAVPYVRLHLENARKANPQATLLVNDSSKASGGPRPKAAPTQAANGARAPFSARTG